ncbi:hypothetical protein [Streptomyces sp. G-G2]|uniref:hypothetical protein n=1 Tax=Streptomyces sp. G-G2 TaxID=3046201 RepID=UPI0024B88DCB|nr:hypothetical protein [Streptomyces sp. G-G2]MDJ0382443.1 hypothetical protein [Streptomyces sp. G-G2]
MLTLKKFKAVVVAVATMAGLVVAVAPAQAADTCSAGGGGQYICDYGVKNHALPNGEKEQFLVGLDYAVWTRWTVSKKWSGWVSMGKPDPFGSASAASDIRVTDSQEQSGFRTNIYLRNSNGAFVGKTRPALGAGWWPWDFPNCC